VVNAATVAEAAADPESPIVIEPTAAAEAAEGKAGEE
jgi:hypothetical protein